MNVPFILIGRHFQNLQTDYVICNDELGGYLATRELIQNGHKRILMLRGEPCISSSRERFAGYLRAHEEAGLEVDMNLVCEASVLGDRSQELYERIMERNLGFTGIFAFSDLIAWDFWRFLYAKGYRIPRDYSLVGFDHIQSRLSIPCDMTSICTYKGLVSVEAVDALVKKMQGKTEDGLIQKVIETKLAEGVTVRPLL